MSTQSATQFITVPSQPNNPDDKEQLQLAYCILTPTDPVNAQKRPALLVRGWQGVKEDWQYVATGLAKNRPVVIFDNRSIGESTIPKKQYTMAEFVNDTYLLITEVIWKQFPKYGKIHIYGASMGGAIVQNTILKYPDLIQSVVIGCSLVNGRTAPKSPKFIEFIKRKPPTTPDGLKQYGIDLMQFSYTPEFMSDPTNKPYIDSIMQRRSQYKRLPAGTQQQSYALNTHNVEDKLPSVRLPVLVQHGTDDSLMLYSNGELLHKLIPHSTLSTFENCGHNYWAHDWQQDEDSRTPTELRNWFNKYEHRQQISAL